MNQLVAVPKPSTNLDKKQETPQGLGSVLRLDRRLLRRNSQIFIPMGGVHINNSDRIEIVAVGAFGW